MKRKMNYKETILGVCSVMAFCLLLSIKSFAASYSCKQYGATNYLTIDQYNQIVTTLAACADDDTSQNETSIHATGIVFDSFQEAIAAGKSFGYLFQGESNYGIVIQRDGASGFFHDVNYSDGRKEYLVSCTPGYGSYSIYVGWLPGSDPHTVMEEQNKAMEVISRVISSAPQDDYSAYKYYLDWLCNNVNYDYSFSPSSYSGYGALATGASVCSGYARAFMGLCFFSGKYCATVSGKKGGGAHAWNAVWIDNQYKWVDATWADQDGWINYAEFMDSVEDSWISYFNEPFCTES